VSHMIGTAFGGFFFFSAAVFAQRVMRRVCKEVKGSSRGEVASCIGLGLRTAYLDREGFGEGASGAFGVAKEPKRRRKEMRNDEKKEKKKRGKKEGIGIGACCCMHMRACIWVMPPGHGPHQSQTDTAIFVLAYSVREKEKKGKEEKKALLSTVSTTKKKKKKRKGRKRKKKKRKGRICTIACFAHCTRVRISLAPRLPLSKQAKRSEKSSPKVESL